MKTYKSILFFLILYCLVLFNIQVTSAVITEEQEYRYGLQEIQKLEPTLNILEDGQITAYMQNIVDKIALESNRAHVQYKAKVFVSNQSNAMSIPGGFIYISTMMIQDSKTESELVGIIAHEIAHIAERHSVKEAERKQALLRELKQNQQYLITEELYKFHHNAEFDADEIGAQMMYYAGWNPIAMVNLLENTPDNIKKAASRPSSTHPRIEDRIQNLNELFDVLESKYDYNLNNSSLKIDSEEFHQAKNIINYRLAHMKYRRG